MEKYYILIDTGYEEDKELFYRKLEELNISADKILFIFLTHHHDDHSGLLNEIKDKNPKCSVIMDNLAPNFLDKGENDQTHGGGYVTKRVKFLVELYERIKKNWKFKFPKYQPRDNDIMIEKDIELKEIGINLNGKILKTPGHSLDSISILFDNSKCFVGDAAANMLQFAGTKYNEYNFYK